MHLDPKALEAAIDWHNRHVGDGLTDTEKGVLIGFTTAYLSASIPAEIGELVERLENERPSNMISVLALYAAAASALRALSAELETVKGENTRLQNEWDNCDEMLQAARAEAKLAGGEVTEAAHGVVEAFRFTAMKSEQLRAYHALIHALRGEAS